MSDLLLGAITGNDEFHHLSNPNRIETLVNSEQIITEFFSVNYM
jgi:hypothetical protein